MHGVRPAFDQPTRLKAAPNCQVEIEIKKKKNSKISVRDKRTNKINVKRTDDRVGSAPVWLLTRLYTTQLCLASAA